MTIHTAHDLRGDGGHAVGAAPGAIEQSHCPRQHNPPIPKEPR